MSNHPMHTEITETGCYLDNHRGHYIARDVVLFAIEYGFIVGPCERYVIDAYDEHNADDDYPSETVIEIADDAIEFLNSGRSTCAACNGTGRNRYPDTANLGSHEVVMRDVVCKVCSGTGRGDRMAGQNFPPRIPDGHAWDYNDGDFGLYAIETDDDPEIADFLNGHGE